MPEQYTPTTEEVRDTYEWGVHACGCCATPDEESLARFDRWLVEVERAAAEKAIKALEVELVGSMDDGTFIAPWVEIPADEIRETIWTVFDSYRAEAYRQERKDG